MTILEINTIPETLDDFLALQAQVAQAPEGALVVMTLALLQYAVDEEIGQQCLAAAVFHDNLWDGPDGYEGKQVSRGNLQLIHTQISGKPHVLHSYFKGTHPDAGYQLPLPPFRFEISSNKYSGDPASGRVKYFIASSGAATPRPVTVKLEADGLWKAAEWSSLIVGVQKPQ